ncbi:MAG TPA: alkaline phosphatase D family protein [Chitinophagales bacterium]|nr:alkaline phosphatase D family protein [Chitinophagales bacterium]
MKKTILLTALLGLLLFSKAQNPEKARLITGPIVGSVTTTTARIWIAFKGNGLNMMTLVDTVTETVYYPTGLNKINDNKGVTALNMDFTGLKSNHVYKCEFTEGVGLRPKCVFTTQADSLKDFDFLVGSCALMNTDISRFVFPGASTAIFEIMRRKKSDFMLWLGDNIYYFSKHYKSYDGMFNRNLKIRNYFPALQLFLASQPHYAIWDDHDYGWNDADKNFPLKDTALTIFKGFWPNTYEPDTLKGNYFTYTYYDAEFFMTDCRYFRDPEGDTSGAYFGEQQMAWLKDKLLNSKATFKFICSGSQVLNDSYYGESYAKYSKERNELLDFIANKNVKGVIFLSGDKHFSEMSKRIWKGYPMYDFTSSPLTSPVIKLRTSGFVNTYSVAGTLLYRKNFGKISISGNADNRICKMEIYGMAGDKKWEYVVNANDLQLGTK